MYRHKSHSFPHIPRTRTPHKQYPNNINQHNVHYYTRVVVVVVVGRGMVK